MGARSADGDLIYRVEAAMGDPAATQLVADGVRIDVPFEGRVTAGALAGARASGMDYVLQRRDGIGVVEARDAFELPGGAVVFAHARGYAFPPPDVEWPEPETAAAPDFMAPDVWLGICAFAFCETGDEELDRLNRTVVRVSGWLNNATAKLVFEGRAVAPKTFVPPRASG
jgi:hypothetical protein